MAGIDSARRGYLIDDPPGSGVWNMAVDQALLERCEQTGDPVLRFYQWSPATLSLGYFQPYADRKSHPPSYHVPVVRRSTGGGAILHDLELTYSLVVPNQSRWSPVHQQWVKRVHGAIIDVIQTETGLPVTLAEASPWSSDGEDATTPFLCFERRSPLDVISGRHKLVGSAQRRLRGALLQHGSILLAQSTFAPELPGLLDLCSSTVDPSRLAGQLKCQIAADLGFEFEPTSGERWYSSELGDRIKMITVERFGSDSWTERR
ncbi:MAG TPA: hypothetical protein PKD54_03200 [Pirellulaceae bacterium]|nr:hypothetical protein [Pirellulaceae bacterium]